jgi:hypothetical protein
MRLGALAYVNGVLAMMQMERVGLKMILRNFVGVHCAKKKVCAFAQILAIPDCSQVYSMVVVTLSIYCFSTGQL